MSLKQNVRGCWMGIGKERNVKCLGWVLYWDMRYVRYAIYKLPLRMLQFTYSDLLPFLDISYIPKDKISTRQYPHHFLCLCAFDTKLSPIDRICFPHRVLRTTLLNIIKVMVRDINLAPCNSGTPELKNTPT